MATETYLYFRIHWIEVTRTEDVEPHLCQILDYVKQHGFLISPSCRYWTDSPLRITCYLVRTFWHLIQAQAVMASHYVLWAKKLNFRKNWYCHFCTFVGWDLSKLMDQSYHNAATALTSRGLLSVSLITRWARFLHCPSKDICRFAPEPFPMVICRSYTVCWAQIFCRCFILLYRNRCVRTFYSCWGMLLARRLLVLAQISSEGWSLSDLWMRISC